MVLVFAHARDVWPLESNVRDKVVYGTARDIAERTDVATTCAKAMRIEFPMLVDGPFGFEAAPLRQALAALLPSSTASAPAAP